MNVYENLTVVDWEVDEEDRKRNLNSVEYRGLESYLQEVIDEYEMMVFGEILTDISEFTFWRDNKIDILEGYELDSHYILSVFMMENGMVYFWCSARDDEEEYYYIRVN
jgi:hypothetical protein